MVVCHVRSRLVFCLTDFRCRRGPEKPYLALDLLPLIELCTYRPDFRCKFVADNGPHWSDLMGIVRAPFEAVVGDAEELTKFVMSGNDAWRAHSGKENIAAIMVQPWTPGCRVEVTIVLKEALFVGRLFQYLPVRCYLPDARRLGMEEKYSAANLLFSLKLRTYLWSP